MDYYKGKLATLQVGDIRHKMPFSWAYRQDAHPGYWGEISAQAK